MVSPLCAHPSWNAAVLLRTKIPTAERWIHFSLQIWVSLSYIGPAGWESGFSQSSDIFSGFLVELALSVFWLHLNLLEHPASMPHWQPSSSLYFVVLFMFKLGLIVLVLFVIMFNCVWKQGHLREWARDVVGSMKLRAAHRAACC